MQAVVAARPGQALLLLRSTRLAGSCLSRLVLRTPLATSAGLQSRHAAQPSLAAAAAAAESEAAPRAEDAVLAAEGSPGSPAKRAGKRKVAMFVGYEGTAYRGLQRQTLLGTEDSIEDVLEGAIYAAGGILDANRGSLARVGWSRSSRTDKSVHSVATVVGLRMEVPATAFDEDPEGQAVAAAINAHLPPEVRVFSIQRVSKSWSARSECVRRSYHYYLPASALGLALDGGEDDRRRLDRLAAAWQSFQGTHAFHNYTRRRLYRQGEGVRPQRKGRRGRRAAEAEESDDEDEAAASSFDEEEAPAGSAGSSAPSSSGNGSSGSSGGGGGGGSGAEGAAGAEAGRGKGFVRLTWKHEKDPADLIGRRHYRYIEWCRMEPDVKTLVPGGQPCIQLSLQGGSFMLHQIRKMVGMAVAVARGALPPELLEASLATPARVPLPLAPPCTLMLTGAQFSPFKKCAWSGQAAESTKWTGEVLELRAGGAAAQQAFLRGVMLPALDGLLAGEEWRQWADDLDLLRVDPAELQAFLAANRAWRADRAAAKAAKAEALLAEAAAAEHRDGAEA